MEMEAAAAAMETEMNFRRRARVLASLPGGRFGLAEDITRGRYQRNET